MWKTENHSRKKYLMVHDSTLDKILGKIKTISIKKFYDTKILIKTDGKLPDNINLKNVLNDSL